MEQLKEFLPDTPKVRKEPDCYISICKSLVNSQLCYLAENVMYPITKRDYDARMIDSLWVLIDIVKKTRGDYALSTFYKECTRSPFPASIFFLEAATGKANKIIAIPDEMSLMNVIQAQDNFYFSTGLTPGKEEKANLSFIITIRDEALLNKLSEMNITVPHKIALIKDDGKGMPQITYFEASK